MSQGMKTEFAVLTLLLLLHLNSPAVMADESTAPARLPMTGQRENDQETVENRAEPSVLVGVDVLQRDGFASLQGARVGLITNHTGISRSGVPTSQLLARAEGVQLCALFSPEHGPEGRLDEAEIADSEDRRTGVPVYSLYGKTRHPSAESLQGLDVLVFDIQDIGVRFYTYIATMQYAMQAAAEHDLRFVVLDRPNPINGVDVAGPVLDEGLQSFVGCHTLPVRHGMTVGELATMFNEELDMRVQLHVVQIEGWQRSDYFDRTGRVWINPSPNMRSLTQATLYPGIGLLETTNLSVGRGTDTPFEVIGAPWLDERRLAAQLNAAGLAGVRFVPIRFTPDSSKFSGELCGGVNIVITDRASFRSVRTGLVIAHALVRLYPEDWQPKLAQRLLCDQPVLDALLAGASIDQIQACYQTELDDFCKRRAKYLLYR